MNQNYFSARRNLEFERQHRESQIKEKQSELDECKTLLSMLNNEQLESVINSNKDKRNKLAYVFYFVIIDFG